MSLESHYHCPLCGHKLNFLNEEDSKEEDVIMLECSNKENCFMCDGVYWTLHHPLRIRDSLEAFRTPRGDDCFSISFIN